MRTQDSGEIGHDALMAGAVEWLLAHRIGTGWRPHKADGPALAALARYYGTARRAEDRYRLTVTVNDETVFQKEIAGDTAGEAIAVPRAAVKVDGENRVRFDRRRITSGDWESYPVLRFAEAPAVDVHLLDRPDLPSLGAGEAAQGPTAAAIANAVHAALGVRVRHLPLTAEAVVRAIEAQ